MIELKNSIKVGASPCNPSLIFMQVIKHGHYMVSSDKIRGHLDAIILMLISEQDRYGYEIAREISMRTDGYYNIKEATLYSVFARLEKNKLIDSYLGDITFGAPRRYYTITELGLTKLLNEIDNWTNMKKVIDVFFA